MYAALLLANLRAAPSCSKAQVQKACREEVFLQKDQETPRFERAGKRYPTWLPPPATHSVVFGPRGAAVRMLGWDARQASC